MCGGCGPGTGRSESEQPSSPMRSVSSLQFGTATPSPSKVPPCVRRKWAKWAKKQMQYNTQVIPVLLKKVTNTFLQAYPTRTLTDDELQALLPPDWSLTCVRDFRHFGLVRVPPSPSDLFIIHNLNVQIGGIVVKGMEKVENPYLFLQYQLKLIESEGSKEFLLFHATSYEKVLAIVKENFNWRLAGSRVGHRHGLGVYFSRSPTFCFNFAKQGRCRCFLVARVPVGAVSTGSSDTRLPGPCADATGDGRNTIVKYHDHEFYPQYVIHF
ncbi:Hypothetical predicted protein [Cloeon dipterum]|uniref:PARP catalytic domain-containing protein n=1 Tax=Cloeon dipterum TaxID=197152 RepID=A0A8S1DXS2_9INSE|nr:Hypothetical predicted protein [Cloeon dipterum]